MIKKSLKTKTIYLAVTNNLVTDQRVHKVATSLQSFGFKPILIGRKFKTDKKLSRKYETIRFRLLFNKGMLFYAEYNLRLFIYLVLHSSQTIVANDIDTLPACWLASLFTKADLIFDAHEIFSEVPELVNRKNKQKIWKFAEKTLIPKAQKHYTVNNSLANYYQEKFNIQFQVIYNVPLCSEKAISPASPLPHCFNTSKKIILYQGAVNKDRGLELLIDSMPNIYDAILIIIGNGDIIDKLQKQINKLKIQNKVFFTGAIPFEQLQVLTKKAYLGISLEQNTNLNYYLSSPNKIFDYIKAEVPIFVSDFPEMKKIVEENQIGEICVNTEIKNIVNQINNILKNKEKYKFYKQNIKQIKQKYCWEKQQEILNSIYT